MGRAPRTKETLPDFLKWRRVTRPPLVFRRLTGSQRTPGFWGATRTDHSSTVHDPAQCSAQGLAENFILLNSRLDELSVESKNEIIGVRTRKLWLSEVDTADSQRCAEIWAHPPFAILLEILPSRNTVFGL